MDELEAITNMIALDVEGAVQRARQEERKEAGEEDDDLSSDTSSIFSESEGEPVDLLRDVMPYLGSGFPPPRPGEGWDDDSASEDDSMASDNSDPDERELHTGKVAVENSYASMTQAQKGEHVAQLWNCLAELYKLQSDPYTARLKGMAERCKAAAVRYRSSPQQAQPSGDKNSTFTQPPPVNLHDATLSSSSGEVVSPSSFPTSALTLEKELNARIDYLNNRIATLTHLELEARQELKDAEEQYRKVNEQSRIVQVSLDEAKRYMDHYRAEIADIDSRIREHCSTAVTPERIALVLSSLPTSAWTQVIHQGIAYLSSDAEGANIHAVPLDKHARKNDSETSLTPPWTPASTQMYTPSTSTSTSPVLEPVSTAGGVSRSREGAVASASRVFAGSTEGATKPSTAKFVYRQFTMPGLQTAYAPLLPHPPLDPVAHAFTTLKTRRLVREHDIRGPNWTAEKDSVGM